jgi:3-oxoacyl-[acyl-carrier-protein] synthase-3
MADNIYSVIKASGCFIPPGIIKNSDFLSNVFYDAEGKILGVPNEEIISKFKKITNISERRHLENQYVTSDMAYFAASDAINSSDIDPETIDYVIMAHNFGDVKADNVRTDMVPSLAARVKHRLGIKNPFAVAYDVIFGCPGWIQSVIQANYYIKSGDAKRVLVIGAEALSRISDPHDRDSMIYSDGAGAVILEAKESNEPVGILSHATRSDTHTHAHLLWMNKSYNPGHQGEEIFLKMNGRRLYEYALNTVPQVIKQCIEKANLTLEKINKVLIHQANEKMDVAILERLFKLYDNAVIPSGIMPMVIDKLGNSSVATIPILLDLILKGKMESQKLESGYNVVFASVGAGMNINAITYKFA